MNLKIRKQKQTNQKWKLKGFLILSICGLTFSLTSCYSDSVVNQNQTSTNNASTNFSFADNKLVIDTYDFNQIYTNYLDYQNQFLNQITPIFLDENQNLVQLDTALGLDQVEDSQAQNFWTFVYKSSILNYVDQALSYFYLFYSLKNYQTYPDFVLPEWKNTTDEHTANQDIWFTYSNISSSYNTNNLVMVYIFNEINRFLNAEFVDQSYLDSLETANKNLILFYREWSNILTDFINQFLNAYDQYVDSSTNSSDLVWK